MTNSVEKILDFITRLFFDNSDNNDEYPIGEDVRPHFELGDDNE